VTAKRLLLFAAVFRLPEGRGHVGESQPSGPLLPKRCATSTAYYLPVNAINLMQLPACIVVKCPLRTGMISRDESEDVKQGADIPTG